MKILHITDLHLDNFKGETEFLREGFFKEYIDRLHSSIIQEIQDFQLDCIIITGDFIDKGKTENFEFIELIIEYITNVFKIDSELVYTSIGNHDYKWKSLGDLDGNDEFIKLKNQIKITDSSQIERFKQLNDKRLIKEIEYKKDYKRFCKKYNKNIEIIEDYFSISKINNFTYFISLDSTWNSIEGTPGEFTNYQIDKIINSMRPLLNPEITFLIGCHFPIISLHDNFLAGEESNWHGNHVWIKANSLHDRIRRLKAKNIIWFHGDVHAGDARNIDNETFILTSKFGCKTDYSEQKRQANLLFLEEDSISRITCNYEFPTHNQNLHLGDWILSKKHEVRKITEIKKVEEKSEDENLQSINKEVEDSIIRKIKEKELYQFGRFKVNKDEISLGWIDISKLLTDKELLNRITDKCYELITSFHIQNSESLFLGLEIIGGILASQLSVRFNINNSIIPVRTKKDYYSEFEFSYYTKSEWSSIKNIVIFIDLISSGKTITDLIKEIISLNKNINIHIITVISNDIKGKLIKIPNTKSYNTFCAKLKIPVVRESEMPDEELIKLN